MLRGPYTPRVSEHYTHGHHETLLATYSRRTAEEAAAHEAMLEKIRKSGACVWDFD